MSFLNLLNDDQELFQGTIFPQTYHNLEPYPSCSQGPEPGNERTFTGYDRNFFNGAVREAAEAIGFKSARESFKLQMLTERVLMLCRLAPTDENRQLIKTRVSRCVTDAKSYRSKKDRLALEDITNTTVSPIPTPGIDCEVQRPVRPITACILKEYGSAVAKGVVLNGSVQDDSGFVEVIIKEKLAKTLQDISLPHENDKRMWRDIKVGSVLKWARMNIDEDGATSNALNIQDNPGQANEQRPVATNGPSRPLSVTSSTAPTKSIQSTSTSTTSVSVDHIGKDIIYKGDVNIGDLVAVRVTKYSDFPQIAKVLSKEDGKIRAHYWGSGSRKRKLVGQKWGPATRGKKGSDYVEDISVNDIRINFGKQENDIVLTSDTAEKLNKLR